MESRSEAVMITGASRGIGRTLVLGLLGAGFRVVLACRSRDEFLAETLVQAHRIAPRAHWTVVFGDICNRLDCERMAAEAEAWSGGIFGLVNNAALPLIGIGSSFLEIDPDYWARVVRTNCDGLFYMTRSVASEMVKRKRGRIINISSTMATMVRAHCSPYGPSKAFADASTRIWAQEMREHGLSVYSLTPGGATNTANSGGSTGDVAQGLASTVMLSPLLWLLGPDAAEWTGLRVIAKRWDDQLPIQERIAAAKESFEETPRIM